MYLWHILLVWLAACTFTLMPTYVNSPLCGLQVISIQFVFWASYTLHHNMSLIITIMQLAGIFQPHDGNCYVSRLSSTSNLDYTMWNTFDHPSIGQVRMKLQENDIIPIFATISDIQDAYMVSTLLICYCHMTVTWLLQNLIHEIPGSIYQSIGTRRQALELLIESFLFLRIIEESYNVS